MKHPNIIMLIEEMDTPTELYLVMELVKVRLRRFFFKKNNSVLVKDVMSRRHNQIRFQWQSPFLIMQVLLSIGSISGIYIYSVVIRLLDSQI